MTTALAAIAIIFLIAFSWYRSSKYREIALSAAKSLCKREEVQLLDMRVSLFRARFCRDFDGRFKWLRAYTFDYSSEHFDRKTGYIALMGPVVILRRLEIAKFDLEIHTWLKDEAFRRKHKIWFLFGISSLQWANRRVAEPDEKKYETKSNIGSNEFENNSKTGNVFAKAPSNDNNIIDLKKVKLEQDKKSKT
jgi:hypothetical protein